MMGEEDFVEYVKIPKERVPVLIGKKGKTKKEIEEIGRVKIRVDSGGGVEIRAREDSFPDSVYRTSLVVRAIGRGFDPGTAELLFSDNYYLEIVDLKELVGRSEKARRRQRGRIIGEGGRARRMLERLTETHIRVYGNTVSIIGDYEGVELAKWAIERLAGRGTPHNVVYRLLERKRAELRKREILLEYGLYLEG